MGLNASILIHCLVHISQHAAVYNINLYITLRENITDVKIITNAFSNY
jgi:hypothetical protein